MIRQTIGRQFFNGLDRHFNFERAELRHLLVDFNTVALKQRIELIASYVASLQDNVNAVCAGVGAPGSFLA
jgi:hypothetical protein